MDDTDNAARLSENSLAAMADVMHQAEEPHNASPGISIDNSQSPTTPVETQEVDPADVAHRLGSQLQCRGDGPT